MWLPMYMGMIGRMGGLLRLGLLAFVVIGDEDVVGDVHGMAPMAQSKVPYFTSLPHGLLLAGPGLTLLGKENIAEASGTATKPPDHCRRR